MRDQRITREAASAPESSSRATSHDEERYVSPSWLARHWGVHIRTIYRDIEKRALPASRMPGGQLRVRWIDARRYGRPVD